MNALLVLVWLALCVLLFLVCRVPMNRWTAPIAVLGGIALIAGLVPALNHFHPYTAVGQHRSLAVPITAPISGKVSEVLVAADQPVVQGDPLFLIETAPRPASSPALPADYTARTTTVRSPIDGFVSSVTVARGAPTGATASRPGMQITRSDNRQLVAWFRQSAWSRLAPGIDAEVAFDAIPGTVFSARLDRVVSPLGAGAGRDGGIGAETALLPVVIDITDPRFDAYAKTLPGGTSAGIAIYGEHLPELVPVRKILLRMGSWLDYLYPVV